MREKTEAKPRSAELISKRVQYESEGLIDPAFIPQGDTDRERILSLEARAYTIWLVKNANACGNRPPETCRSMFQMRHDPYWTPPALEIPEAAAMPPAAGFTRARDVLQRGDAWEGPDPE